MTETIDQVEISPEVLALQAQFIAVIDQALAAMGPRDVLPKSDVSDILVDARNSMRDALN